jgi:hypothetical protein
MIPREVMGHVWCQCLQHLVVVVILDIGEALAHELLDEVAVDHSFFSLAVWRDAARRVPF